MTNPKAQSKMITRDQLRALHAYKAVGEVKDEKEQKDYKIAVNDLGVNILRSGLCAALATVQRVKGERLLAHLAAAEIPGLKDVKASDLVARVRNLDLDAYMIATREMLRVALWLKRAVQASFDEG